MGCETSAFLHHLAEKMSCCLGEEVLRVCLAFAIICATGLCVRESCAHWCSDTSIDDETDLPDVPFAQS